jgi:hypothetical protein
MAATRSELVTRAKARGDFENDGNITSTVWNSWADVEHKAAWRLMARINPHALTAGPTSFTLTGTTDTYALSTLSPAFYKLLGLDYLNGSDWQEVIRFNFASRNRQARAYRVLGTTIRVTPPTAAAGTYRVWYIPEPTAFAADGSTIDAALSMHDEIIVLGMAIRGRSRQRKDASELMAERQALVAEMMAAGDRDDGTPDTVRDVETSQWLEELPSS